MVALTTICRSAKIVALTTVSGGVKMAALTTAFRRSRGAVIKMKFDKSNEYMADGCIGSRCKEIFDGEDDRDPDDSMRRNFSIIYRHCSIIENRALKEFGLTGRQMAFLKYISEHPGASQEELSRSQCIDKGAVAKSVKDMISKGYISKKRNCEDMRAYRISLTPKGSAIYTECRKEAKATSKKILAGFSEEEARSFGILLSRAADNILKEIGGKNL